MKSLQNGLEVQQFIEPIQFNYKDFSSDSTTGILCTLHYPENILIVTQSVD